MKKPTKRPARKSGRSSRQKIVLFTFLCSLVVLVVPYGFRLFRGKRTKMEESHGRESLRASRMIERREEEVPAGEFGNGEGEVYLLEPISNPPKVWSQNLVLAMGSGLKMNNLSIFINSFSKNMKGINLVIFAKETPEGWRDRKNVFLQIYRSPTAGWSSRLGFWTERFLIYEIFLKAVEHKGRVVLSDSLDVAFFGDPFQALPDTEIHFFQESTVYPPQSDGGDDKYTDNYYLMANCFTERIAWTYSGSHVLSSGFVLGPTEKILFLLKDLRIEFSRLSVDCLNKFGSDQATLNHVVKSGRLRINVPSHKLESNERGPVLTVFIKKGPFIVIGNSVVTTMGEKPFKVIHGYNHGPDLNRLVQKVFGSIA